MMTTRRTLLQGLWAAGATAAAGPLLRDANAQSAPAPGGYPARPIRLLVGFPAGGGADAVARTIALRLGEQLGQSVIVDNRPGATSTIAAEVLAKSPADGHTLMLADSSLLIAARAMAKVNFDVQTSFDPIGSVAIAPLLITVAANSPLTSLEQMAEVARKGDPKLIYATSGIGTVHHLAMEYLQAQAKISMTHLPYRGASQILPDLIGGQVPIGIVSAGAAVGAVQSGRIRVLGVTSPVRLPGTDWRAIADWLPGFDASPRLFLIAPAGTPAAVIARLDAETEIALKQTVVIDTLLKQGAVATHLSSAQLARELPVELARWTDLIKRADVVIQ